MPGKPDSNDFLTVIELPQGGKDEKGLNLTLVDHGVYRSKTFDNKEELDELSTTYRKDNGYQGAAFDDLFERSSPENHPGTSGANKRKLQDEKEHSASKRKKTKQGFATDSSGESGACPKGYNIIIDTFALQREIISQKHSDTSSPVRLLESSDEGKIKLAAIGKAIRLGDGKNLIAYQEQEKTIAIVHPSKIESLPSYLMTDVRENKPWQLTFTEDNFNGVFSGLAPLDEKMPGAAEINNLVAALKESTGGDKTLLTQANDGRQARNHQRRLWLAARGFYSL